MGNGFKIGNAQGLAYAAHAFEQIDKRLGQMEEYLKEISRDARRRHFFDLEATFEIKEKPVENIARFEPIPQGKIFIAKRYAIQAPKGSKLQLFANAVAPSNFLDVIANVQEFAEGINGDLVLYGPATLLAVFTNAEAAGQASISIFGELVERNPHLHGHTP